RGGQPRYRVPREPRRLRSRPDSRRRRSPSRRRCAPPDRPATPPLGRLAALGEKRDGLIERKRLYIRALGERRVQVAVLDVGAVLPFEELHRTLVLGVCTEFAERRRVATAAAQRLGFGEELE